MKQIRVETGSAFLDVLEFEKSGLRAIVRPAKDYASGQGTGELVAWCDGEADEGLEAVEIATACRKLQCKAVELAEVHVECPGDAGGAGGGVVKVKGWIPKQEA